MLLAEAKLCLELKGVGGAGLDPLDVLPLRVELSLERLHPSVVTLDLGLEHVLIERALSHLLLKLAILGDEKLLLPVHFLDHLAVFLGHLFDLLMHRLNLRLLRHERHLRLLLVALAVVEQLSDLELEGLELLRLHRDRDLSLVALLLLALERQAMNGKLLAHGPILLQHDLLVLLEPVQLVLGLDRRLREDLLEVDSCMLTLLQLLLHATLLIFDILEEE